MQTARARIADHAPRYLYIGDAERAAIARLKKAAMAAPRSLGETAARLARRRCGEEAPEPPAWTIALRFGFFASYRIEDWPDGRWQRLSIRAPAGRWPAIGVVAVLLGEFGFTTTRLTQHVAWRGQAGGAAVLHVAERIGPLPKGDKRGSLAEPATPVLDDLLTPVDEAGDEAAEPE